MPKPERTYTLKEFLEAEMEASVSVQWAEAGRSDEQTARDIEALREQLAKDSALESLRVYKEEEIRRTWEEWVAYIKEGDEWVRRARERGIDEDED